MLDKVCYCIGATILFLCAGFATTKVIVWLFASLVNELSKNLKVMWVMLEFAYYRKEFKEWVKDKERHIKYN